MTGNNICATSRWFVRTHGPKFFFLSSFNCIRFALLVWYFLTFVCEKAQKIECTAGYDGVLAYENGNEKPKRKKNVAKFRHTNSKSLANNFGEFNLFPTSFFFIATHIVCV